MAFLVTSHGGKPSNAIPNPFQYVVAYICVPFVNMWIPIPNVLNLPPPADKYNELRDIQLASDGNLYVVNSYKDSSVIWQIPKGGLQQGQQPTVFTGASVVSSIYHPFSLAFDSQMTSCYVSNQDTNVVVRVYGSGSDSGQATAINSSIPGSNFLPGTFVASQLGILPPNDSSPTPSNVTSEDGGLAYSPSTGPPLTNSVRGVAVIGSTLYVADEVGDCVRIYDTGSGAYQNTIHDPEKLIRSPVHLLASGTILHITSSAKGLQSGGVLSFETTQGSATSNTSLQAIVTGVANPSGLTFDGSGNLYVASRTGQYINMYNYNASSKTFTPAANNPILGPDLLTDQPEFILWFD